MDLARTHILLGVDDAARSAAFYEALLGAPPASREDGVTVFESDTPPLVLTLQKRGTLPRSPAAGRKRSARGPARGASTAGRERFALVVPEPEHVGKAAVALWRTGAPLRLKDQGIEAEDPDGNAWQVRFVPYAKTRAVIAVPSEDPHEGR